MHWPTTTTIQNILHHFLLLPSILTPQTHAIKTIRIWTTFAPTCPTLHPGTHPADLNLNEQFSVGLTIRSGVCQPVPIPIPYVAGRAVGRAFFSASSGSGSGTGFDWGGLKGKGDEEEEGEKCTVRLFEWGGCFGEPLLEGVMLMGSGSGGDGGDGLREEMRSECRVRERKFAGEVFVRVDCGQGDERKQKESHALHTTSSIAGGKYTNSTAAGNSTVSRRWQRQQRRRLSLLGA
ncbi:hypothetical protein BDW59DRAFT_164313 [Aspergillus cavernicola]|uniref:Uncharacterized protein n=1 Tax=Aspergillus cavernicola TaxID=176166 RepID=A0ABR4I0X3_9EURO